jgi:hypothetical protein
MKFFAEAWVAVLVLMAVGAATSPGCCASARPQQATPAQSESSSAERPVQSAKTKSSAATDIYPTAPNARHKNLALRVIERGAADQRDIWTAPAKFRLADADWIMPLTISAAALFVTDTEISKHLSNSPSRLSHANTFSDAAVGALGGVAGGLYVWGMFTHDDHKKETGFLAAEAAANSVAVVYALKYTLGRDRPLNNNFQGNFWSGGDSFPSEHAAAAWSIASVVAHEYPGVATQILAYGAATAVSLARVDAKQHFPSDVLIGSAIGWLSGEMIYRAHHDPELPGSAWQTYRESRDYLESDRPRQDMGTTFVELDSWIYPAMDRLAGLGYVHNAMQGLRPWTRMQCALLTSEAEEKLLQSDGSSDGAAEIIQRLRVVFAYELERIDGGRNIAAQLDSVYTRAVSISGPDLTDSLHFGQTSAYDFGRPFERGIDLQDGGAFRAELGPIGIYVRAEYQHAPGAPALPAIAREFIATRDLVPEPPGNPIATVNRVQLLDAYISLNLDNWQIVAGRQTLSWGPGSGGSMILSDNSPPIDMVRMVNSEPERLPGFLKYLGPMTIDDFFGRLSGGYFIPHPFLYGNKISFKPLDSLEIGYSRTVTIGGKGGNPLTPANFFDSFFGRQSTSTLGASVPGDNHANLDWTFTIPKLHNYLVFYGDWYTDDDIIALQTPRKSAFRPGLYFTHLPGLPKFDLHVEATSTAAATFADKFEGTNTGNLNYWNFIYRDGYTNDGLLLGNTVGRLGQTYQGWLTYWASKRENFQITYKNSEVSPTFVPGGGAFQDYGVNNEVHTNSGMYVKTQFQYEHISHFPILFSGPQRNFMATVEIGFLPAEREKQ